MNDMRTIGTVERPYTHAPPLMAKEGMPWGAYCRCATCGRLGRSVCGFDFYGDPGQPLVCGACKGIDHVPIEWSILYAGANPELCDSLGPGCRGGYVEGMGALVAPAEV